MIEYSDFQSVDMRVGTVISAELNPKARQPAIVLVVDFGEIGMRTSSAQLTDNYSPVDLIGTQVVAVVNFPVKRVAGVKSEVLILGAVCERRGTTLLQPTHPVQNGTRIA